MAQKILILGDSGSGKSASLRNFKPEEVLVINSAGKPLPFKNHFETVTPSYGRLTQDVLAAMDATKKKVIIIDDAQYIMSFQYMRRIKENGWDKWNDIQGDFFRIIQHCDDLPPDTIVYFLSHIQRDDEGHEKLKTMGKMLDEKITLEGLFTVVLKTNVADGQYCFLTQTNGRDTVKSPIGMFDSYAIDNDLKYVDAKIRNYYEIGEYLPDEAVREMDEEVAKPTVEPISTNGRKRRSRTIIQPTVEPTSITGMDEEKIQPLVELNTTSGVDEEIYQPTVESTSTMGSKKEPEEADQPTVEPISTSGRTKRSRKVRNGQNEEKESEEASVEEKTEEDPSDGNGRTDDQPEPEPEQPKRRRRQRTTVETPEDYYPF